MSSRTNDGVNMKGRGAIDVLPTPVMLLDLDILEENIRTYAEKA